MVGIRFEHWGFMRFSNLEEHPRNENIHNRRENHNEQAEVDILHIGAGAQLVYGFGGDVAACENDEGGLDGAAYVFDLSVSVGMFAVGRLGRGDTNGK